MIKSIFHQDSYIFTENNEIKNVIKKLNININPNKIINVVGTNGKGSTSYYIYQGLISNKKNVGLFTSPHTLSPCEMIEVNHRQITQQQAEQIIKQIIHICPEVNHFNTFVKWYLIALVHFLNTNCDFIVLEACLGGEGDMTNTIPSSYGVLTSIAEDHIGVLGKNKKEIAINKSKIIKNQMSFCIPSYLEEDLSKIFKDECGSKNATWFIAKNESVDYQVRNSKLAREFLKYFFNIKYSKEFKNLPGRTEFVIINENECILDVGHNEEGVIESLKHMDINNKEYDEVVIMMGNNKEDIDFKNIFKNKKIYFYKNKIPDIIYHPNFGFKNFEFQEINNMKTFIDKLNKKTLFIGSFHLIGEVWKLIQQK